jgi:hypothetical protein
MKRRTFLQGAGVASVLVAAGGVWRAEDQGVFSVGQGPAYRPWKDWRSHAGEGPLTLIRAAILAASPHNTQPWLFKVAPSSIDLYIDTKRNVGALDPYLREEHIGIGCAIENLMLAAAANGYTPSLKAFPGKLGPTGADPKPALVATIDLAPGMHNASALYEAIPLRHTNRGAFNPDLPLPQTYIDELARLPHIDEDDVKLFLFPERPDRKKIVANSAVANATLYSNPDVVHGSEPWIRLRWSDVQKYRDGLTIDCFGLPPVAAAITKIIPESLLVWIASRQQKNAYADLMSSAPLIGMIAVRNRYDREQCLHAGRIWQRAHLFATSRGVAARPCNEAVELVDHETATEKPPRQAALLANIIGSDAWQPTFVFYMGNPALASNASPRRAMEMVMI